MGINPATLYKWLNDHGEINEALKKGKAPVDIEVENALLKRARGYSVTVKKPVKIKTKRQLKGKGIIEEEHIEYVDEEVYIPPDTTAQIYWLNNRRPDRWRTRKAVEIQTEQPHNELLQSLFDLERRADK